MRFDYPSWPDRSRASRAGVSEMKRGGRDMVDFEPTPGRRLASGLMLVLLLLAGLTLTSFGERHKARAEQSDISAALPGPATGVALSATSSVPAARTISMACSL
jgi:hypothetical protein